MALPIQITEVKKSFQRQQVLKAISLEVQSGELFGLIGLNGMGKTTLIKVMLDLIQADSGAVSLFGISSRECAARKAVAYVPEKCTPHRNLRGYEYIALSLAAYDHRMTRAQMDEAACAFDLAPAALAKTIRHYSKGMGQKLALMTAFLTPTQLLILDEPMSGLDPRARAAVKKQMHRAKAEGRTVFFSSHILADMQEICDRIAVMHEGALIYVGDGETFRAQHGNGSLESVFLHAIGDAA